MDQVVEVIEDSNNYLDFWEDDWKLMEPKGGKKIIHARGCEYIKDWDMAGCRPILKYNPKKHTVCKSCSKLVYATFGAKDYVKNIENYRRILGIAPESIVKSLYVDCKAKTQIVGDKFYIKCRKDNWYIDFGLNDIRLFHNNYNIKQRLEGEGDWTAIGYHEHTLKDQIDKFKLGEALLHITQYDFKEKHHEPRVKKKEHKMTFSEYDEEYYRIKNV